MGNPTTNCKEVLKKLYLYLDGEIAGEICSDIEAHLGACLECADRASFERDLKEIVARKCREGEASPELTERLRARIRQILG